MKRPAQSYKGGKKKQKTSEYSFSGNKIGSIKRINRETGNNLIVPSVRSVTLVSAQVWSGSGTYGALSFKLSDLPNYSEYTALYDEYRIKAVKVMFIPNFNVSAVDETSGTTNSYTGVPALYTWIDTDDNTAPTAITAGQQFQTFKCHGLMNTMRQRTLIPEVSTALYSGSFTSYGQLKNQWIDNNSPSVVHYGLKYGILNGSSSYGVFDCVATYYLEFRKST